MSIKETTGFFLEFSYRPLQSGWPPNRGNGRRKFRSISLDFPGLWPRRALSTERCRHFRRAQCDEAHLTCCPALVLLLWAVLSGLPGASQKGQKTGTILAIFFAKSGPTTLQRTIDFVKIIIILYFLLFLLTNDIISIKRKTGCSILFLGILLLLSLQWVVTAYPVPRGSYLEPPSGYISFI